MTAGEPAGTNQSLLTVTIAIPRDALGRDLVVRLPTNTTVAPSFVSLSGPSSNANEIVVHFPANRVAPAYAAEPPWLSQLFRMLVQLGILIALVVCYKTWARKSKESHTIDSFVGQLKKESTEVIQLKKEIADVIERLKSFEKSQKPQESLGTLMSRVEDLLRKIRKWGPGSP